MPEDSKNTQPDDVAETTNVRSEGVSSDSAQELPRQEIDPMSFPSSEVEPSSGTGSTEETPGIVSTPVESPTAQSEAQDQNALPEQPSAIGTSVVQSPKNNKKKLIIGGVVAAALVILGGGGALAYSIWSQSPDKVIMDGLANLLSNPPKGAKLSASIENKDITLAVTADSKGNDTLMSTKVDISVKMPDSGVDVKTSVDAVAKPLDGVTYIKLNDIQQPVSDAMDKLFGEAEKSIDNDKDMQMTEAQRVEAMKAIAQQKKAMHEKVDPLVAKFNNQWVKFSAKTDGDNELGKVEGCLSDITKQLRTNKALRDEVVEAYSKNKFITVKEQLGVKDGNYGYVLGFDQAKGKAFGNTMESSQVVKKINKCMGDDSPSRDSSTNSSDAEDNFKDSRVELWVNQQSHQITSVKLASTHKESATAVKLDTTLNYESSNNLAEPTDAVDAEPLIKEIENFFFGGLMSADDSTMPGMDMQDEGATLQPPVNNRGLRPSMPGTQKPVGVYDESNRT